MTLFYVFIFESRDKTGHTYFHARPKKFWSAFNFCDHISTCKKSVYIFQLFIPYIQSILESHQQTGHI